MAGMGFECSIALMAFRSFGAIGAEFGDRSGSRTAISGMRAHCLIWAMRRRCRRTAGRRREDDLAAFRRLIDGGRNGRELGAAGNGLQQPTIGPEDEDHAGRPSQGNGYHLQFFQQNFRCAHPPLP